MKRLAFAVLIAAVLGLNSGGRAQAAGADTP